MIEVTKQTVFTFILRIVDHWPVKVAAIIAAVMLWLFVSTASVLSVRLIFTHVRNVRGLTPAVSLNVLRQYRSVSRRKTHGIVVRFLRQS